MADTATMAAAVKIVSVTIKVIEAGYDLLSDPAIYGEDAPVLSAKFQQLSKQFNSLQRVLLKTDKFSFFQGESLFQALHNDSQMALTQLFLELLRLLYSQFVMEEKCAIHKLSGQPIITRTRNLGLCADDETAIFSPTIAGVAVETYRASNIMSAHVWIWTTKGRKKAARLNTEFHDWFGRTKGILDDAWRPLIALHNFDNLRAMQLDHDCQVAGFSISASQRILIISKTTFPTDLEISWDSLESATPFSPGKSLAIHQNKQVLVEDLLFPIVDNGVIPDSLEERLSRVVGLLRNDHDPGFKTLRCLSYTLQTSGPVGRIRLVSALPETSPTSTPRTLVSLFRLLKPVHRPSLALRFALCYKLAESVFLLHSIDWLHRALRSDNVIFMFPDNSLTKSSLAKAELKICGFDASRPSVSSSVSPHDNDLAKNVYRHPHRWSTPRDSFTQLHDVYALGVVLLEIGLWEQAENIISDLRPNDKLPEEVNKHLLRYVDGKLAHCCGDVFASAVRKCLTGNFEEDYDIENNKYLTSAQRLHRLHRGLLELVVDPLKILKDLV